MISRFSNADIRPFLYTEAECSGHYLLTIWQYQLHDLSETNFLVSLFSCVSVASSSAHVFHIWRQRVFKQSNDISLILSAVVNYWDYFNGCFIHNIRRSMDAVLGGGQTFNIQALQHRELEFESS